MASTIDQEFIEYIVKTLVGNPDKVKVKRTIDERGVLLELHVDPEDLGRVIGRSGSTAKSIRILLRALGVKNDARYNLKIVDNGERPPRRERPAEVEPTEPAAEEDQKPDNQEPEISEVAEATPDEEPGEDPADEETSLDRHRQDVKEFTDFDI